MPIAIVCGFVALNLFWLTRRGVSEVEISYPDVGSAANALAANHALYKPRFVYILFLSLTKQLGLYPTGAIAFQLAIAFLAIGAIYDLARKLACPTAGLLALALWALNPEMVRWHSYVHFTSLHCSSAILAIWCVDYASQGRHAWLLIGLIGLSFAVFFGGWPLLPISLTYWCVQLPRNRAIRYVAISSVLAASSSLLFASKTIVEGVLEGLPQVWFQDGEVIRDYDLARQPMPERAADGNESSAQYALRHPVACAELAGVRLAAELAHVRPYYSAWHNGILLLLLPPVYLLAVYGLIRTREFSLSWLLVSVVAVHLISIMLTYTDWDGSSLLYASASVGILAACGIVSLAGSTHQLSRALKLEATSLGLAVLLYPFTQDPRVAEPVLVPVTNIRRGWTTAATHALQGFKVSLSEPVPVARSQGYLWFPNLIRLANGDLLATMSNQPDVSLAQPTMLVSWSTDAGLNWTRPTPKRNGESNLRLSNGDHLVLPTVFFPRDDGIVSPYSHRVPSGRQELSLSEADVTVKGWPRLGRSMAPELGLAGFYMTGQTVALPDGGYLATLFGYFREEQLSSLVAADSWDGLHWQFRSIIADARSGLSGREGPDESALCRLKDGRLMCVFRQESGQEYGQTWSRDDGRTWSRPQAMPGIRSVRPCLTVMPDGMVVLSGGRPGIFLWLNPQGTGQEWQAVDLLAHHNACKPQESINRARHTTSYTQVVVLDEQRLLVIYDRVPFGWHYIPKNSSDTNSVWVVRIQLEKTT